MRRMQLIAVMYRLAGMVDFWPSRHRMAASGDDLACDPRDIFRQADGQQLVSRRDSLEMKGHFRCPISRQFTT